MTCYLSGNRIVFVSVKNCLTKAFTNNLDESGIHGALAVESMFNVDYLYSSLKVPDEARYFNMKKILEDEIRLLKKTKTTRQDTASKPEPAFLRSFNSLSIMSFRVSYLLIFLKEM